MLAFLPEEALEYVDFVVRGEGEDTLVELVEAIQTKGDFSKIAGLSFRADGQKIHNEPRPLETNLDRFPIPDFSLVRGMRRNGVVSVILVGLIGEQAGVPEAWLSRLTLVWGAVMVVGQKMKLFGLHLVSKIWKG